MLVLTKYDPDWISCSGMTPNWFSDSFMPCADLVFQLRPPTVSYSVRPTPLSICFEHKCVEVNLILESRHNVMMTTLKYTTAFIIQQRIIHPPFCCCPCPDMADTSRNPFSPSSSAPMAKKVGGGQKNAVGVPAAVKVPPATAASAGTPKKTRKSTKQKNRNPPEFSDLDSLINVKPSPRVLCHCWSPTHGEMLFGQLGLCFHNHPQTCIFLPLTSVTRSLTYHPPACIHWGGCLYTSLWWGL